MTVLTNMATAIGASKSGFHHHFMKECDNRLHTLMRLRNMSEQLR